MEDVVSIVLTAKNIECFITRCLDSLIKQSYEALEIIAVDDGSKDNTIEIIQEHIKKDKRIKLLFSNSSNKQKARNLGIKNATGKYLIIIDGDDELPLDAIERLVGSFEDDVDAVFGGTVQIYPNGKSIEFFPKTRDLNLSNVEDFKELITFLYSAEFLGRCLIKREKAKALYQEDVLLWDNNLYCLRLLQNCKRVRMISNNTYNYYYMQRKGSSMVSLLNSSIFEKTRYAYKYFLEEAKKLFNDKNMWFLTTSILIQVLCSDTRCLNYGEDTAEKVIEELSSKEVKECISFLDPKTKEEEEFKEVFLSQDIDRIRRYLANCDARKDEDNIISAIRLSAIQDVVEKSL